MKSKEELNALKEEAENLNKKPAELTEDELEQVSGGFTLNRRCPMCGATVSEDAWTDHQIRHLSV